ncbi:MAG: 3-dehydroquinate synthase [Deltaproteobacteria bacterium]|nr:3-dehydroquinate synthase [Deltaproteobacteria bacterium]
MKLAIEVPAVSSRLSHVHIGSGLLPQIPGMVAEDWREGRVFWVVDKTVWLHWGRALLDWGWPNPADGNVFLFEAAESRKTLRTVEDMCRRLAGAGADRGSALVAVGGGVTGDVAGFVASVYMRGIPHYQVPTTLLAQVDSSIGGKTGVDLPEGKNLVGAFHQPRIIWMDLEVLGTLPREEFRQGMAEVIKTAMIGDAALWEYLETHQAAVGRCERDALQRIVSACSSLKKKVVEADERESGRRRVLNLGHTVGHALERVSGYQMRHGDAVAAGMVAAARLSVRMGYLPPEDLDRLIRLCAAWDLPVKVSPAFPVRDLLSALEIDKKRIGGRLHFILPVRIGEVLDHDAVDSGAIEAVLGEMQS